MELVGLRLNASQRTSSFLAEVRDQLIAKGFVVSKIAFDGKNQLLIDILPRHRSDKWEPSEVFSSIAALKGMHFFIPGTKIDFVV